MIRGIAGRNDNQRVRIVVWNMSHWQRTAADRVAAWSALHTLGADVALLQETSPPASSVANVVYREIGGRRPWGSAVVGITTRVQAINTVIPRASRRSVELVHTVPGAVAVAAVPTRAGPLAVVSVYGLIENGYAVSTVHRQLGDLTPLFDAHAWDGRVVFAGDLNLTTQWTGRDARYLPWHRTAFARIREFGLVDCLDAHRGNGPLTGCRCADGPNCRHIQTLFHPASARPWQNDYVFTSAALLPLVTAASPVNEPDLRRLSDHLPLVVDMDI